MEYSQIQWFLIDDLGDSGGIYTFPISYTMYNDGFSYPIVVAIDNIQTGESHVLGRDVRISYISNEFAKIAPVSASEITGLTIGY